MNISAVDLFCGAGGLTRGLQDAGIDVRAGYDIESQCEYPYEANNDAEFVEGDLATDVDAADIAARLDGGDDTYTLIAGCAPCQPFSSMSNGNKARGENHEKWGLLSEFGAIVERIEPDFVTMENVPAVEDTEPYTDFVSRLGHLDYEVSYQVADCLNYGVPQQRRRLVLLASRHGEISLIGPTHDPEEVTVEWAFSNADLPAIEAGDTAADDVLHQSAGLSDTNIKRIQASEPGGTWMDWPEELRLACHTKKSGRKYVGPYGRMEWDEPGPTITTQFFNYGSGRFGHPEQDRAISLREGALLQTFPADYEFAAADGDIRKHTMGKLIGNAVPVALAQAIGISLQNHAASLRERSEQLATQYRHG